MSLCAAVRSSWASRASGRWRLGRCPLGAVGCFFSETSGAVFKPAVPGKANPGLQEIADKLAAQLGQQVRQGDVRRAASTPRHRDFLRACPQRIRCGVFRERPRPKRGGPMRGKCHWAGMRRSTEGAWTTSAGWPPLCLFRCHCDIDMRGTRWPRPVTFSDASSRVGDGSAGAKASSEAGLACLRCGQRGRPGA